MERAVNPHVWNSAIFPGKLDAASRLVVGFELNRYDRNGKLDLLLGKNRTPDMGTFWLGNSDAAGIADYRFGYFLGWGKALGNLCPLWLGMSAIGYLLTGLAVRSRALLVAGLFHLLGILILPYTGGWLFLFTGFVMVFSLLVLAELQWDMRRPIDYAGLTPEQQDFNRKQQKLRQVSI